MFYKGLGGVGYLYKHTKRKRAKGERERDIPAKRLVMVMRLKSMAVVVSSGLNSLMRSLSWLPNVEELRGKPVELNHSARGGSEGSLQR
jgi:hypothetical protein